MQNNTQNNQTLPQKPEGAVQQLCRISMSLLDLAERESQALIQRDMITFSILQDEKESLSQNYLNASEEFRTRLNEFRRVDSSLLTRLEGLQSKLGERTQDNNQLIENLRLKAEAKTQDGLLLAQEYGKSDRANFASDLENVDQNTATQETQKRAGAV